MIKIIPHPVLTGARRLTPLEMNNLHFRTLDNHTPIADAVGIRKVDARKVYWKTAVK
ncbi:MAG: hypothetical protein OSJ37_10070 [Muribaculaceae bacterium]|jgi:hypothetical protein|nr:hypothetical protein [Muribaculaceae bacterium]